MIPVSCRQADWLPCSDLGLDKLRGVVLMYIPLKFDYIDILKVIKGRFRLLTCSLKDTCTNKA